MANFPSFDDSRSGLLVGTWQGAMGGAYETVQGWFYREEYLLHNLLASGVYVVESGYTRDYSWDPISNQKGSIVQSVEYQPVIGVWGTGLDDFTEARTGFSYFNILTATGIIFEDVGGIDPAVAWNIGPYYQFAPDGKIQLASSLDEFAEVNLTGYWERKGDGSGGSFSPAVYDFEVLRQQDLDADGKVGRGNAEAEMLISSPQSYVLPAGFLDLLLTGNDPINGTGNSLNNRLVGNSANNVLNGLAGSDVMEGGKGNDIYFVDNRRDVVKENKASGRDVVKASVSYALPANVENLDLIGADNINGTGNNLRNRLKGNSANNVLNGRRGPDLMIGGKGNDTYIVDNTRDVVRESKGAGIDTVRSSVDLVLARNVENLVLIGARPINGSGNGLNNDLIGNSATNILNGRSGNDLISGGGGDDSVLGGLGQDTLAGGLGADTFVYKRVTESSTTEDRRDIITDFSGLEGDRIDLSVIDAFNGETGNQAFIYIGSDPFSGTRGEVRFASSILQANTGKDRLVDMEIELLGVAVFEESFLVL